jgi:hypothetical protein
MVDVKQLEGNIWWNVKQLEGNIWSETAVE